MAVDSVKVAKYIFHTIHHDIDFTWASCIKNHWQLDYWFIIWVSSTWKLRGLSPLVIEISFCLTKIPIIFLVISPRRYRTNYWYPRLCKTTTSLSDIVNTMVADDLTTHGTKASAGMILTCICRNIPTTALNWWEMIGRFPSQRANECVKRFHAMT